MDIDVRTALLDPLPEDTVGNRIRKKRFEKGLNKKDLANYINSTPKTVDSYEFDRSYPSPKRLVEIAKCLDTPLEYFFDEYYEFIFNDYNLKIKHWRMENKLSLRDAAKLIGINSISLDRWEKGDSYPDKVSYNGLVEAIKNYTVK